MMGAIRMREVNVSRLADLLFWLLKALAATLLVAMLVMVFGNVVLRYAFNEGITVSEELSSWCLTWVTYTAGLVALREHGHLGFDGFLSKLPSLGRRFLLSIAHLIMIAILFLFLHGSWLQTQINLANKAPASGIPVGALYGVGIVFSVIAILVLLGDLIGIVTGRVEQTISSEGARALADAKQHSAEEQIAGRPRD